MSFTAEQVQAAVEAEGTRWGGSMNEFEYAITDGVWNTATRQYDRSQVTLFGLPVEMVAQHGGEGEGDSYWFVIKLGDQLFKFDGWYQSYAGHDIERVFEVEARPVERVDYVKVDG